MMTAPTPSKIEHKITCRINTSIFYPWEIGHYFKHQGQRYRIEKIIENNKYAYIDDIASEITADTPIENQMISSLIVGVLVK